MHRAPLHIKISLYVTAGLVLIFLLLGLLGYYVVNEAVHQSLRSRLALAKLAAFNLDAELENQFTTLEAEAQDLTPVMDAQGVPADLRLPGGPFVLGSVLVDTRGRILAEGGHGRALLAALQDGPLLAQSLAGRPRIASDVVWLPDGHPAVALLVPVRSSAGVGGSLVEGLDPSHERFAEFIRQAARIGETGHGELVDGSNQVIAAATAGLAMHSGEHPNLYTRALTQGEARIDAEVEFKDGRPTGQRHLMIVVPLQNARWVLAIGGTEAEMLAPEQHWTRLLLAAGLVSLILALALVWVTTQAVAKPVSQLTDATRRVAEGDLDYPVPVHADAEVGQLARSFDDMRRRLAAALSDLRVEKSQYEAAFRSMADILFTVDERFQIVTFNPASEQATGLRAEEVVGLHACAIFRPEKGEHTPGCPLGPQPVPPHTPLPQIDHYLTPAGNRLSMLTTRSPIVGEDGRTVGTAIVMHDMSGREELQRLQDEFISTVSHELKTPLGVVKGYATTLLRRDTRFDHKTWSAFLRIIDESADELKGLIDDLLDMSRIGARALKLDLAPVSLADLTRRMAARIRATASDHRIRIDVADGLPPVLGDAQRLEQVLANLLTNAVKYSPAGTEVRVTARVDGECALVQVCDQGPGVPPDEIEAVFERFYRSPEATRRGVAGTGLGLTISRGIVQAHGGQIWVDNRPVCGAVFSFTIPLAYGAEMEAGL